MFSAQVVPIHSAFALVLRFTSFISLKARVECILYDHFGLKCIRSRILQIDERYEFYRRRKSILPVLLVCIHKQIELHETTQSKKDPVDHTGNGSWNSQQFNCSRAGGKPAKSSAIVQTVQSKWFDLYERRRDEFDTLGGFIGGYNDKRPHASLDFENAETPSEAFTRKLRPEDVFHAMVNLFGW